MVRDEKKINPLFDVRILPFLNDNFASNIWAFALETHSKYTLDDR